ncbi:hypothetical protein ASD00_08885 [Ensifer sp. Root31]|nr:hypothetical protein ASD00_08885 [Ensifer sp. Root31]
MATGRAGRFSQRQEEADESFIFAAAEAPETLQASAAHLVIAANELNGAASPANCARNRPGPLIVFIANILLMIWLPAEPAGSANDRKKRTKASFSLQLKHLKRCRRRS